MELKSTSGAMTPPVQLFTDIKSLPVEHPIRNTPLGKIEAEYRVGTAWRKCLPSFGIAKVTYNQLGEVWAQHEWRTK